MFLQVVQVLSSCLIKEALGYAVDENLSHDSLSGVWSGYYFIGKSIFNRSIGMALRAIF